MSVQSRAFAPCKQCLLQARRPQPSLRAVRCRAEGYEPLRKAGQAFKQRLADSAASISSRCVSYSRRVLFLQPWSSGAAAAAPPRQPL